MSWFEAHPKNLQHIGMFGYQVHNEDNLHMLATHTESGKTIIITKAKPLIWFDDIEAAMQFGVTSIIKT